MSDGTEAVSRAAGSARNRFTCWWQSADVVIGNPPFLGDKSMLGTLGKEYVTKIRALFSGRLPGGVDLVTYWFEKARAVIAAGDLKRAGLVATQAFGAAQTGPFSTVSPLTRLSSMLGRMSHGSSMVRPSVFEGIASVVI